MSIESDILAFTDILNDETKSPATRVLAGDTLRYLLVREGRLTDAEPIAQAVKHIGVRAMCDPALSREDADAIYDALERTYITLAPNSLHDYLIALEWNRPAKDRFYQPRMSVMQRVADAITDMVVHDKYDIVEISSPPRIGKSTIGIFAISWCIGRNCNNPILATGYAEKITKMFYGGLNEIYEDEQYNYHKIFPLLELIDTSAKDLTLDFRDDGGKTRRKYPSLTCRPIDGSLTGATEARQLLYCDDLVRDIEEAMNKDRLDTLYDKYISNAQSRMKEGCKQLIIGTRWSLHDPMSRIAAQYDGNDRCKVICIPALDPETDESNFDYPFGVGFSSDYYRALRTTYETNNDTVTWECVYQQNPIEREGLVFPKDELTFVTSLPDIKKHPPDDIFAFIDVAFGGTDFLCMPIAYQWGDDPPVIMDVIYMRGDYEVTEPVVAGKLIQHNVARALFEANNGGDFYSRDIAEKIKELAPDYHCFISTRLAPNNKSKETRIIQHSPAVKSFSFRDTTIADAQYRQYIQALTTYTLLGKNQNDDAPDASAGLASMMRSNLNATLQVFDRRYI